MDETAMERLKRLAIRPTRSLSQNFLNDIRTAKRIVESAEIYSSDTVLEIGPGLGMLSDGIVEKAGKTILIEKDSALISYLEGRYSDKESVEIIHGDVLQKNIPEFDKVVSNLPFGISSPVTFKLLKKDFRYGVLTYQKEYAERMLAGPEDEGYSRLSVMVSTFAEVEKLFDISRNCFYPRPDVDATVLKLTPSKPDFYLRNREVFSKVVKELFNYRRKKIKNALEIGFDVEVGEVPYGEKRVDNISPAQINELVNYLVDEKMLQESDVVFYDLFK